MPDTRRTCGSLGERIAEQHLVAAGYRILARNFRTRHGELDLVAIDDAAIVFCEVKARVAGTRRGPAQPLDSIGPGKRRRVRAMAAEWLADEDSNRAGVPRLRFDAIGVVLSPGGRLLALEHVKDAF